MATKPPQQTAAGYIRVSTPGQVKEKKTKKGETEKEGSLETQKLAIQNYCKQNNFKLLNIYEDAGISGAKSDRPALMKLLEDAKAKKFDAVIEGKGVRS